MFELISVVKHLMLIVFFHGLFNISLSVADDDVLGPADLIVKDFSVCEDPEQYPNTLEVSRKKLNRTFESFSATIKMGVDLDPNVGIYVNVAKWGDGGYKPNFLIINDTDVCAFFFKWLGNNMQRILRDDFRPESCPITKGDFNIKNFLVNYDELPQEMVYGDFKARVVFVNDGEEILCFYCTFLSKPKKDN